MPRTESLASGVVVMAAAERKGLHEKSLVCLKIRGANGNRERFRSAQSRVVYR